MQTGFLRDRLQRCRGELSQIIQLAHDLEQAEDAFMGNGTAQSAWNQPSRYGYAGADDSFANSAGGRHQSDAITKLERIRQAADQCAATLSDVEREVDAMNAGQSASSSFAPAGQWRHNAGFANDRQSWSTGTRRYPTYDSGARSWSRSSMRQDWNAPGSASGAYDSTGWQNHTRSNFGGSGRYGAVGFNRPATYSSSATNQAASAYPDSGTFSRPTFRSSEDRFGYGSSTVRGAVPPSQQGGYDYGAYGSARAWDQPATWSRSQRATADGWEREPMYAGGRSRY